MSRVPTLGNPDLGENSPEDWIGGSRTLLLQEWPADQQHWHRKRLLSAKTLT